MKKHLKKKKKTTTKAKRAVRKQSKVYGSQTRIAESIARGNYSGVKKKKKK